MRNACLSPASKDIFIYLVRSTSGFLATNAPDNAALLFDFITQPKTTISTGKVDGLGIGVHVAFVTTEVPAGNRFVGSTAQKAVQIIADDTPNSPVFGVADVGTPTGTGDARVFPLTIKNYVNSLKGGQSGQPAALYQTYHLARIEPCCGPGRAVYRELRRESLP